MRTCVTFRADRFDGADDDGNRTNPDIRGAGLTAFLSAGFAALGYAGTVTEEDWGWMVKLARTPFPLWLGCSSLDGEPGWRVFIEPDKPQIRKLFKTIDTRAQVERVAGELEHMLLSAGADGLAWQD